MRGNELAERTDADSGVPGTCGLVVREELKAADPHFRKQEKRWRGELFAAREAARVNGQTKRGELSGETDGSTARQPQKDS